MLRTNFLGQKARLKQRHCSRALRIVAVVKIDRQILAVRPGWGAFSYPRIWSAGRSSGPTPTTPLSFQSPLQLGDCLIPLSATVTLVPKLLELRLGPDSLKCLECQRNQGW